MKKTLLILLILLLSFYFSSLCFGGNMNKEFIKANNEFGFKLLKDLKDKNTNIMISPISIESALGALSGAGATTEKNSILQALGANSLTIDQLNQNNKELLRLCKTPGKGITLNLATSLWLQNNLNPNKKYKDFLKNYYNADISNVNFANPDKAADIINQWCSNKTNHMVSKAVDKSSLENASTVLCNALYFFGTWTEPFDEKLTREDIFTPYVKSAFKVAMMSKSGNMDYVSTNTFKAIKLNYGTDKDFSIDIIVPNNEKDLNICLAQLEKTGKSVFETHPVKNDFVKIYIPRFQMDYQTSLIEILEKYGLKRGDYKNLLETSKTNRISNIIHSTKLKVNEKGTEASAVTSIIMPMSAFTQEEIRADKPFVFYIYDTKNKLIFFTGIINSPDSL